MGDHACSEQCSTKVFTQPALYAYTNCKHGALQCSLQAEASQVAAYNTPRKIKYPLVWEARVPVLSEFVCEPMLPHQAYMLLKLRREEAPTHRTHTSKCYSNRHSL